MDAHIHIGLSKGAHIHIGLLTDTYTHIYTHIYKYTYIYQEHNAIKGNHANGLPCAGPRPSQCGRAALSRPHIWGTPLRPHICGTPPPDS